MSCISNDPFKLARMAGYYKGVQSAGAAVSFGMDAVATPFLTEHLVSWIMLLVSLPLCGYVLWSTNETNYEVEGVVKVEDVDSSAVGGAALPKGHHMHEEEKVSVDEKVDGHVANVMRVQEA